MKERKGFKQRILGKAALFLTIGGLNGPMEISQSITYQETPPPPQPISQATPTPEPPVPGLEPTPTPSDPNKFSPPSCEKTDLKAEIVNKENHFVKDFEERKIQIRIENVAEDSRCVRELSVLVYGSDRYPNSEGWLENQVFRLEVFRREIRPGEEVEVWVLIPVTGDEWCQIDAVDAAEYPIPPVPPYLRTKDYVFTPCSEGEGVIPTPPTEEPTATPIPLPPTGNPPDEPDKKERLSKADLVVVYILTASGILAGWSLRGKLRK